MSALLKRIAELRQSGGVLCTLVAPIVALLAVPALAALSERRTVFLVGYVPHPLWMIVGVIAAVACVVSVRLPYSSPTPWMRTLVLVAPLIPYADLEFRVLLCLACAAGVAAFFRATAKIAETTLAGAAVLASGLAAAEAYASFDASYDLAPWLAPLFALASLGSGTLREGGNVALEVDGTIRLLHTSLDKLGGIFFACLVGTYIGLGLLRRVGWRRTAGGVVLAFIYAVFYGVFSPIANAGLQEFYWLSEVPLIVAFLPLSGLLSLLVLKGGTSDDLVTVPIRRYAMISTVAGVVALVFGWCFVDPGKSNPGIVVIDESRGDWEDTRSPLDKNWFGSRTVYNYYNFGQSLKKHFAVRTSMSGLDEKALEGSSVVILKSPTRPYDDATVDRIVRFVEGGGGLWLVGDHTDAFGMNTYLNKVAHRFGLGFHMDAFFEHPVKRNLWAPTQMSHPVVRSLPEFLFYTGCSLQIEPWDTPLMVADRLVLETADYSAGSFFGPLRVNPSNKAGSVVMAALAERGAGRVAMWGDSTLFSNFSIYAPGKLDLGINTIEWLGRSNRWPGGRVLLLAVGSILFLVGLLRTNPTVTLVACIIGTAVAPVARKGLGSVNPLVEVNRPVDPVEIAFLDAKENPHFPYLVSIDEKGPSFYLSSFVAAQRAGLRPQQWLDLQRLDSVDAAVFIPPGIPLHSQRRRRLMSWVRDGGTLIVLDGGKATSDLLDAFASDLNLRFESVPRILGAPPTLSIQDGLGRSLGNDRLLNSIRGGQPILFAGDKKTVCGVVVPVGRGSVFMSTTTDLFSDQSLGDVHSVPNDAQLLALRHLMALYEKAVRKSHLARK